MNTMGTILNTYVKKMAVPEILEANFSFMESLI